MIFSIFNIVYKYNQYKNTKYCLYLQNKDLFYHSSGEYYEDKICSKKQSLIWTEYQY